MALRGAAAHANKDGEALPRLSGGGGAETGRPAQSFVVIARSGNLSEDRRLAASPMVAAAVRTVFARP
ncbi:hypothetical protein [Cohnella sp. REN36]|uniref:hypothetical protein n=1 Tax=Cohnella sp. REN36 TaxID=2887347 RepID=UPI001D148EE8|nr:hypothetical protein [Cohnella sp. REN36]MCC3374893.1 hypothetical protein [Cohnella sp. REN36]